VKRVDLPISRLSLAQKLDLMETLWADLTRDEKKLESPAWHGTVLEDREKALKAGKVTVSDWEQAKKRIKKKVSQISSDVRYAQMYERETSRSNRARGKLPAR
jgi:putative addiction module component (TIGR02574 family)